MTKRSTSQLKMLNDSRRPRSLGEQRIKKAIFEVSGARIASELAEATGTNKKTAAALVDALRNIAYREAKKSGEFVIPGIGKLVKKQTKARTDRNPATGAEIRIPAKTVIRFRVAKAAKDALIGAKK